jgi:hypothetical protein
MHVQYFADARSGNGLRRANSASRWASTSGIDYVQKWLDDDEILF